MKKSFPLKELAALTNSELVGNPRVEITGVADLSSASESEASFLGHPRYEKKVPESKAGAIFIRPDVKRSSAHNFLITDDPYTAFQKVIDLVYEGQDQSTGFEGIHPSATIHPEADIGEDVTIGPRAVIDKGVSIGAGSSVAAGVVIGLDAAIGKQCEIHPNVVIKERCVIGDRVIVQSGVVIGESGYGYTQSPQGGHVKLKHYGIVEIGDDVEIGANTTIARARFHKTTIGAGTKIDCLVEIGHNVQTGKHCLIVGQSVIAGSTKLGDYVMLGGKTALDGHLEIATGVMLRAFSGVSKSIKEPGAYGGLPAQKLSDENRMSVHVRKIDQYVARIKELESRLDAIESLHR